MVFYQPSLPHPSHEAKGMLSPSFSRYWPHILLLGHLGHTKGSIGKAKTRNLAQPIFASSTWRAYPGAALTKNDRILFTKFLSPNDAAPSSAPLMNNHSTVATQSSVFTSRAVVLLGHCCNQHPLKPGTEASRSDQKTVQKNRARYWRPLWTFANSYKKQRTQKKKEASKHHK